MKMTSTTIPGWMTKEQLAYLRNRASQARIVVELGCWQGRSTYALAEACPGVVFAVDHWKGAPGEYNAEVLRDAGASGVGHLAKLAFLEHLKPFIADGKVIPVEASAEEAWPLLAKLLAHRRPDMVFVDADHEYASIFADLKAARELVAETGIVAGHDWDLLSVANAVQELLPGATSPATAIYEWRRTPRKR